MFCRMITVGNDRGHNFFSFRVPNYINELLIYHIKFYENFVSMHYPHFNGPLQTKLLNSLKFLKN